jgi:apolipoprotein N-acyltransferase
LTDLARSTWKLPLLSGVLLSLAYSHPFLVPNLLGFVPMLWWLDANRDAGARRRFGVGFLFGCALWLTALRWVLAMLEISPLAILMYGGLTLGFSIGNAISIALAGWIRRRTGWSFVLILPLTWLPVEWSHTWGDLRMTADHVSHSMAKFPFLVQFADLVGPYGVGAVVLVVNALAYEVVRGPRRRRIGSAIGLAALVAFVLAYDAWSWTRHETGDATIRVAVIQPNVPLDVKREEGNEETQYDVLTRLTHQAGHDEPDLIVWPESAHPDPIYHWTEVPETFEAPVPQMLARLLETSILFGVEYVPVRTQDDFDVYNAALAVHPDGTLDPVWTAKVYLVPFTETIPLEPVLGPILKDAEGEWRWMAGGFAPGPSATVVPVAGARAGVLVCYEGLFWELPRGLRNAGADLQVVITNDAWFGRTFFQDYIADALRMRSIESRTSFVRAANTGISGFVDPRGRYLQRSGIFEEAVLTADVPLTSRRTVYDRTGDFVAWIAIGGLVFLVLVAVVRERSARPRPSQPAEGGSGRGEREPGDSLR